jgi:hypothetical protein
MQGEAGDMKSDLVWAFTPTMVTHSVSTGAWGIGLTAEVSRTTAARYSLVSTSD